MLALNQVFFFFSPSSRRGSGAGFDEPERSVLGLQHVRLVYSVGLIPARCAEWFIDECIDAYIHIGRIYPSCGEAGIVYR